MSQEWHNKHRPAVIEDVVGQEAAVKILGPKLEDPATFPHLTLLTGPSGCGKTTIAKIIKTRLGCSDQDFKHYGTADTRGIETVRLIEKHARLVPMRGPVKIWVMDEFHLMTNEAQNSLLLLFESPPRHAYFVLCTTNAAKVLPTIRNRATEVKLGAITDASLAGMLKKVTRKEGVKLPPAVLDKVVDLAQGSARKALVLLEQAAGAGGEDDMLACLEKADTTRAAFDIVKALLWQKTKWSEIREILAGVDDDPEQVRRLILACATKEMLKDGARESTVARAARIITYFRDAWYDCGQAGLVVTCYEVFKDKG